MGKRKKKPKEEVPPHLLAWAPMFRRLVVAAEGRCPWGAEKARACPGLGPSCPSSSCLERFNWTPEERAAFDAADDQREAVEASIRKGVVEILPPAPCRLKEVA